MTPTTYTHDDSGEWLTNVYLPTDGIVAMADGELGSLRRTIWCLQKLEDAVPVEFRGSECLEIDDCSGCVEAWYRRPATLNEIAEVERQRAMVAADVERRDRCRLAELKAKYEPDGGPP